MLATIRNLLIWIAINVLELLSKIYYIEDPISLKKFNKIIYVLMGVNFLSWFLIAVGDGSSLENSNFNLGYNCRLIDWIILSGLLLIITTAEGALAYSIVDRLNWEEKQK